jgi:hypothetical protein
MLQFKITGVDSNGQLKITQNGNSEAGRNEDVHWKVEDSSDRIAGIYDIRWKRDNPDPHNYNIFSHYPPQYQGSDPVAKHWKGIVNKKKSDAPDDALYYYSIFWQDNKGGQHEHDPIISIRPSFAPVEVEDLVILAVSAAVGFLTFKFLWNTFRRRR